MVWSFLNKDIAPSISPARLRLAANDELLPEFRDWKTHPTSGEAIKMELDSRFKGLLEIPVFVLCVYNFADHIAGAAPGEKVVVFVRVWTQGS